MSDVFEFRDFSMLQAPTGQRINTDSCVFAELVGTGDAQPRKILDIGAGTGVITLMLARRFPDAKITAVEPESTIADVAQKNFEQDTARDRIDLRRLRIQDLDVAQSSPFDLLLCNPPFFQNSTLSANRVTAVAKHSFDLSTVAIYQAMLRLMTPKGSAWLAFPEASCDLWLGEGRALGLHQTHQIIVCEHPAAKPHMRVVGWARSQPTRVVESTLFYRTGAQGALSLWMQTFRRKWFPSRFNHNTYAVNTYSTSPAASG